MKVIIRFSLFIVLTFSICYAETEKIGVILPLSGDAAWWGTNCRRGIELAIKEAKEKDPNRNFPEFVFEVSL